jgi:hypothetical protein
MVPDRPSSKRRRRPPRHLFRCFRRHLRCRRFRSPPRLLDHRSRQEKRSHQRKLNHQSRWSYSRLRPGLPTGPTLMFPPHPTKTHRHRRRRTPWWLKGARSRRAVLRTSCRALEKWQSLRRLGPVEAVAGHVDAHGTKNGVVGPAEIASLVAHVPAGLQCASRLARNDDRHL